MNVKSITAKLGSKEYTVQVNMENEKNFNGDATGVVKYVKGGKIVRDFFWIESDGANQFIEWHKKCSLTEKQADHFGEIAFMMYFIQNSENLLESVREDLRSDSVCLSPEDIEELQKCEYDLIASTTEDRKNLFQKRGL